MSHLWPWWWQQRATVEGRKAKLAQINLNLSDSARLHFDSPAGYKHHISVSNVKSKRLCTHQQATEPPISLIVSRHGYFGSWPLYSWCHCFPLKNADKNSKAMLRRNDITEAFTFLDMPFCWHRQDLREWKHPEEQVKENMEKVCFYQRNLISNWSHKQTIFAFYGISL